MGSDCLVALALGSIPLGRIDQGNGSVGRSSPGRYTGPMASCSGRWRSPVKFQDCRGEEHCMATLIAPLASASWASCLSLKAGGGRRSTSKFAASQSVIASPDGAKRRVPGGSAAVSVVVSSSGLKQKRSVVARATKQEQETTEKQEEEQEKPKVDVEETTRKLGLEAGLWQIFTSKEKDKEGAPVSRTTQAKDLLTRYGGAYLATSISLSLVSFGLCYVLFSNGVDVTALLEKVGISTNETGEKVGTFALAYAAHKAASPIRFPPTVALTPIVAGWFGKKPVDVVEEEKKP